MNDNGDDGEPILQIDLNRPVIQVVLGLPGGTLDRLRRGKTVAIDFTGMKIPLNLVLTGGADQAAIEAAIARATRGEA